MEKTTDRIACAYKEIYEILKIFPIELVKEIPKEKLEFFFDNMDKDYQYNVSVKNFDASSMLEETAAILTILFRDYWATPEQREKIINYQKNIEQKQEKELNEKYSYDNLFKKKNEVTKDETSEETTAIIEYKEPLWKRIINIIIGRFKK